MDFPKPLGDTPEVEVHSGLALPASIWQHECGACCAAPDISSLNKPLAMPCTHLQPDCRCAIYAHRPPVCHNYQPDWVCGQVSPLPTLNERVARFLELYQLGVN
jgi:uncharacterized protein